MWNYCHWEILRADWANICQECGSYIWSSAEAENRLDDFSLLPPCFLMICWNDVKLPALNKWPTVLTLKSFSAEREMSLSVDFTRFRFNTGWYKCQLLQNKYRKGLIPLPLSSEEVFDLFQLRFSWILIACYGYICVSKYVMLIQSCQLSIITENLLFELVTYISRERRNDL